METNASMDADVIRALSAEELHNLIRRELIVKMRLQVKEINVINGRLDVLVNPKSESF